MKLNKVDYKTISKGMKRKYIPIVILIIILIIVRQVSMQEVLEKVDYLSKVITNTQRQEALSQGISNNLYALYLEEDANNYLDELKTSIKNWSTSYIDLKSRRVDKELKGSNNDKVAKLFDEVEESYQVILRTTYEMIELVENGQFKSQSYLSNINIIRTNEEAFQIGLVKIATQYQAEKDNQLNNIKIIEIMLFMTILLLIMLEILHVFIPVERVLMKAVEESEEGHENMLQLFKIAHGAMFLIEQESSQVILMNEEAERMLQVEGLSTKLIDFAGIVGCNDEESSEIIRKIKENDKNKDIELTVNVNKREKIITLLSSQKINFNKTDAILIGLFDVTLQRQAEEILTTQAITDKLTGLYNRHYLDKRIKEEIERSDRYDETLSMIMVDLDNFKNVNDTWGHLVGDEVLVKTAEITSGILRGSDIIFRIGGEEFFVLMPHTDAEGARNVAEKMRIALENNIHPTAGMVTASFGVAERIKTESINSMYKRSDEALYFAKELGRNRVECSDNKEIYPFDAGHIEWKSEWGSGNKNIDDQKHKLLDIANNLRYMSLSDAGFDKTITQLDTLMKHIVNHFDYEEQVQVDIGYPDYLKHSEKHKEIVNKAQNLKESYRNGELKSPAFVSFVIDDVFMSHVLDSDIQFFPYIKKNDVESKGNSEDINKIEDLEKSNSEKGQDSDSQESGI